MEETSGESLEESLVEESLEVELWRSNEDWRLRWGIIWDAFGRHLEGWRLRKHLGGIWRSDLTKVQHLSAIMQKFPQHVVLTMSFRG